MTVLLDAGSGGLLSQGLPQLGGYSTRQLGRMHAVIFASFCYLVATHFKTSLIQILCACRFASLQALLHLSTPQLLHLLQLEPRLLMPSSQHITQNHTEICLVFGVSAQTLNRWVAAAPMILLIAAQQLEKRVSALSEMLAIEAILMGVPEQGGTGANSAAINDDLDSTDSDDPPQEAQLRSLRFDRSDISSTAAVADLFSSRDDDADSQQPGQSSSISTSNEGWVSVARDAASMTDYISKDPRVLLLSPTEIKPRLRVVQQELMCSWECLVWLVMNHPSYLVVEPGSLTGWMFDVRHLCQMSSSQAIQLASCPQVGKRWQPGIFSCFLAFWAELLRLFVLRKGR